MRKSPRFSNAFPMEYRHIDSPQIRLAHNSNISEGGLLVSLPEEMEVGERLRLKITLFPDRPLNDFNALEVTGRVVWVITDVGKVGGYQTGLEFEAISPENLENLRGFLTHFGDRY
jgi:Tfp pilus assembly protein PilZ